MHLDELRHLDNRLSKNESVLLKKHADTFASWIKQKVICYLLKQRFTLDEESKSYYMRTVGRLWRSCKTRLRRIIDSCKSDAMIMKKRPKEIDLKEWKFFVKGKSSPVFKKKKSAKPSSVVRVDVWAKVHTKANGEPSNEEVAKNLVKIEELKMSLPLNSTAPPLKDDMFSQVLGPERQGRVRALRFGVTPARLGIIS
ncbi:hypothetical protein GIB67_008988 [Kingdonia uniflora]|uniref:Uncharacterized protein n=1 Tax=Kingdonia uniflora TaxID=39325 RepID=A0A7J7LVW4_9MAGN|nr:hypothetical protein GIB67_008988 [Kingdonia uniflora]